ncbi:spore germination protein [Paenibacillus mendelii]|uniref:Spore germination protein n=1 Tax=Paenibacillus mendelii TaxID=206163 RepID=A0ABV6JKR6_9BACL|nr:spore germination protein [Paenibacillus mendelii]MCQ6560664.1 spore germination protein [Paenibacillus mendelii]
MKKPDKAAKKEPFVVSEHMLQSWFGTCNDVLVQSSYFGKPPANVQVILVYCSGMTETRLINDIILPDLKRVYNQTKFVRKEDVAREAEVQWTELESLTPEFDKKMIIGHVFEGHLLLCFPSLQTIWTIDIANFPSRSPEESATEVSIRGPKDGFVELVTINVALIRKRLRSSSLACEYHLIGERTMTKVAFLYIKDVANPVMIRQVRRKLERMNIESLLSTNQMDELLTDSNLSLFPITGYTGRPDFAVECLLNGRFIVLVDGNPTVLIAPVNLFLLLKSPEDSHLSFLGVNVGRLLRLAGLLLTIFLPGFYIALTVYHMDQVPFPLLATISLGRQGLPMESGLEMFFIMSLMELFREAGVRLPSTIGQTLTVVGGLIIGDAAIRAGIVSPLMIVVTAITVVAGATLVNQVLTSTSILLRFASFIMAATLGMYGFILSIIIFAIYLSGLTSFGVPYLAPVTPLNLKEAFYSLFRMPFVWRKRRPAYLDTQHPVKKGRKE